MVFLLLPFSQIGNVVPAIFSILGTERSLIERDLRNTKNPLAQECPCLLKNASQIGHCGLARCPDVESMSGSPSNPVFSS